MISALFFLLGLAVGSLANAIAWRFKHGKDWLKGRSECPKCHHRLTVIDLIPLASWLGQKGRCRYCKKPVSPQYPLAELVGGVVFASSYIFWPGGLSTSGAKFLLVSWLVVAVGLLILAIYDLNYQLLPSKILYPTAAIAIATKLYYLASYSSNAGSAAVHWLLAVAIAGGVFYLIYLVSGGAWIGFGDVRLGLITGTVLAQPQLAFLMIFVASLLGLAFMASGLARGNKKISSKVAYGPFLIAATWLVLLFGQSAIDWYNRLLI